MDKEQKPSDEEAQKPPVFKSWGQFYLFVLVFHAFIIALFYWFTHAYA